MAIKKLPSTGDAPRSTGVPESLVAGGAADSAGFPWEGRTFDHHGTAFSDDAGETPVHVAEAVGRLRAAARAAAEASSAEAHWAAVAEIAAAHGDVIAALATARVLVPMLAEAGDLGLTPEGKTVEKTQELSIVTVAAPDGRRVLPVFSSVETLGRWHDEARPIPVPATQAALAAVQEETDLLILDAATPEAEYGVRRPALRALALGEPYVPAWADDDVHAAFRAATAEEPAVVELWLAPGDPEGRLLAPEVDVHLRLAPGLDRAALSGLLERLQGRWASAEVIAERVDSMRVRPSAA
ncbi:SseB family protein [Leucobacter sp. PH1c]|uniref:SseB family protein n=1 Tax=Leucobacter sp. PH1c TaxID=1397278 RepID=UPI00046864CB|nr:SseB family protein [Leucobacter sp. PH1c]